MRLDDSLSDLNAAAVGGTQDRGLGLDGNNPECPSLAFTALRLLGIYGDEAYYVTSIALLWVARIVILIVRIIRLIRVVYSHRVHSTFK